MLQELLRKGFTLAHQRPGLLLLDILWKILWAAITVATVLVAAAWMTSDLRAIEWEATGIRAVDSLIAGALLRDAWSTHAWEAVALLFTVVTISAALWLLLEALVRRSIVRDVHVVAGFSPRPHPLRIFAGSSILKYSVLFPAAIALAAVAFAGAASLAVVTFLVLLFFMTLMDTLIRADAFDLLGTDLFRLAGLLGILMSFEMLIGASVAVLLSTVVLRAGRPIDVIAALGAAVAAVLFLNLLHSYLLLVRFSAIAIMRQNVVEV